MNRFLVLVLSSLLSFAAQGQRNTLQLIRVSEDNDGLNTRREINDRQYTNGTQIEVLYTKQAKPRFLSALLIPIASQANNLYGIGLTHLMYTPTDIKRQTVVKGDRPYTAVLYVSHSLTSADPIRKQRLTTELSLGVLGKAALGEELQEWVHRQLGFDKPQGWPHQLPTDVVVNYQIQYEKQVVHLSPYLQLLGVASANVGTLSNNINAGFLVRAGLLGDQFINYERPTVDKPRSYRTFQFFLYGRPVARLLLDDSTLQGGVFSRKQADYVLMGSLLNRSFVQLEYGAVLTRNRLGVSFSERWISEQFKGAPTQQIGNITLFVGI